jgi:hypothetical protein
MFGWLERLERQRLRRAIRRADRRLDGHVHSLLEENPSLPPDHEAVAVNLVEIGSSALGDKRSEVRAIGERLSREGGASLMLTILNRAHTLSVSRDPQSYDELNIYTGISKAWSGIDGWPG